MTYKKKQIWEMEQKAKFFNVKPRYSESSQIPQKRTAEVLPGKFIEYYELMCHTCGKETPLRGNTVHESAICNHCGGLL